MQTLQRRLTAVLVVLVGFCFAPDARTQTLATIDEAQARDWAAYAAQKAAGDQKTFDEVFKNLARIVAPSYRADPFSPGVTLYSSNALDIVLIGQVSAFQSDVSEAVRKMTPIDKTLWPCGASVYVFPSRIDSPDIERIVVKRAGSLVEPVRNLLVVKAISTRAGVTISLHSGSVCYLPSVFAPGAEVIVVAIPVVGTNISKTLNDADLKMVI